MHEDELALAPDLAQHLVLSLLPDASPAEIREVETSATTHRIVRIGASLTARFPRLRTDPLHARAAVAAEHEAMAEFARHSPFPSPEPVAIGDPTPEFPMPWPVQTWIPGFVAGPTTVESSDAFAHDLADLLTALRRSPTRGRTFQGPGRGGDLTAHDDWVQQCLERSHGLLPVPELAACWSRWRELEPVGADVMSHGDLIPANLLTAQGRLLDRPRRSILRTRLGSSGLEWERGAAWAFEQAIGLVRYDRGTNPTMEQLGRSTLYRLLEDPSFNCAVPPAIRQRPGRRSP